MINQNNKCIQVCGVNIANIFVVGLLSGLIGVGIAYFVLVKSVDFHWWWLLALFGAQFVSVIVVAYALQKISGLSSMFCETPALVMPHYDWSNLCKPPKMVSSDCTIPANDRVETNSADWQDLLQQLDQMSNTPVVAITVVSDVVCLPVATAPAPVVSTFDFSSIASGLATSVPITTPSISDKVATPPATKVVTAPVESVNYQGIDFSSFFR